MAAALAASPLSRGRFQRAAALSGGWSLADPDASACQLAERFAPLAVEDGLFPDPASAAGWLLTPGADVREWLCGLEPARKMCIRDSCGRNSFCLQPDALTGAPVAD